MSADTIGRGFGSDVVAGDDASGVLWILSPGHGRDDRTTTGDDAFNRVVTGGISMSGRDTLACNAVTLSLSLGAPSQSGATATLLTSDDLGQVWLDHGSVAVDAADYTAVVEWRGLGLIRDPGRIFRIEDNGAAVRISAANLR